MMKAKNYIVAKYWIAFYCSKHCTLCGNTGIIDTRNAKTPNGLNVGRLNYCICPNGQAYRDSKIYSKISIEYEKKTEFEKYMEDPEFRRLMKKEEITMRFTEFWYMIINKLNWRDKDGTRKSKEN